jgi:hypothetical protein
MSNVSYLFFFVNVCARKRRGDFCNMLRPVEISGSIVRLVFYTVTPFPQQFGQKSSTESNSWDFL